MLRKNQTKSKENTDGWGLHHQQQNRCRASPMLYRFVLSVTSRPGGARPLFFYYSYFIFRCFLFFFILMFQFVSLSLSSFSPSSHCLLCLLYYNVVSLLCVSWFCDHRSCCIPLGGRIGTGTGCTGCRRVERTV